MRLRALARQAEDEAYAQLRAELLPGPCGVCPRLADHGLVLPCSGTGHELHHRRKRSSAGALAERRNVVVSCHAGNMAVEDHPGIARDAGLVLREGDPDWAAMSARRWRKNHA